MAFESLVPAAGVAYGGVLLRSRRAAAAGRGTREYVATLFCPILYVINAVFISSCVCARRRRPRIVGDSSSAACNAAPDPCPLRRAAGAGTRTRRGRRRVFRQRRLVFHRIFRVCRRAVRRRCRTLRDALASQQSSNERPARWLLAASRAAGRRGLEGRLGECNQATPSGVLARVVAPEQFRRSSRRRPPLCRQARGGFGVCRAPEAVRGEHRLVSSRGSGPPVLQRRSPGQCGLSGACQQLAAVIFLVLRRERCAWKYYVCVVVRAYPGPFCAEPVRTVADAGAKLRRANS